MTNLITRTGWEARLAAASPSQAASTRVTRGRIATWSTTCSLWTRRRFTAGARVVGFAESFGARGPRDGQGRSLREFDLRRRLFKYPCSYMIYTPAFDALPAAAKNAVYSRLWEVLSGKDSVSSLQGPGSGRPAGHRPILRETKRDLPEYFKPVA